MSWRWAVVMEYVDGASTARLLDQGPLPPAVALEIVDHTGRIVATMRN